jgi:hypothetical protein
LLGIFQPSAILWLIALNEGSFFRHMMLVENEFPQGNPALRRSSSTLYPPTFNLNCSTATPQHHLASNL